MLFKDKKLQIELEQNGFVIIPFLNTNEVDELNKFYKKVHYNQDPPNFIENIHMTIWCEDKAYKQTIADGLNYLFANVSEKYFENYRRLNNVFIVKKSGQQTTFKVHQDWNVVDETKYQSVNVWIPLHDVDEKTGALWVLKGSHKIDRKIRGAGYLFPDYSTYTNELEKEAVSVNLKAGEAIVFYHSVIHGSPPNLSCKNREAACFTVIPKEAPLCIYFQHTKDEKLQQHQPDDDFMFKYKNLRQDTYVNPPTSHPYVYNKPFINKPVEKNEIDKIIITKKYFWKFWK